MAHQLPVEGDGGVDAPDVEVVERIGQAATTLLFMDLAAGQFPNYPTGNTDDTHLQETGARLIAQMTLADLYRQRLAPGTLAKMVPAVP